MAGKDALRHLRAHIAPAVVALVPVVTACAPDPSDDGGAADAAAATDEGADADPTVGGAETTGAGTGTGDPDANAPSYYEDVRPLLVENCSVCHTAGGIGPFDLQDYETARGVAAAIVEQTATRTMPPFNADNSGACNTWADARWLEEDEIELLARWVEGGARAGDASLAAPVPPALDALTGEQIIELSTAENYLPVADQSGPQDDYQCFLAELNEGDAPIYIRGYEVVPGNREVTHHMVAFLVDLEADSAFGTNRGLITTLDNASPDQPGWDCFGAAGNGVRVAGTPITWAPGGGAFNFPEGTGIRVDPGYALVLQTHYNLANGAGEDTTKVRLSVSDTVEREAVNALFDRFLAAGLSGGAAEIPPQDPAYVYSWDERVGNFDPRIAQWDKVEIFGVLPHMHELGRRMQVSYVVDGEEACGLYVDRWDFQWQQAFIYEQPFVVSPNDTIRVSCEWDSTGREFATQPGLGTQQEMCLLGIYAAEG